jgi:hypothetical protein
MVGGPKIWRALRDFLKRQLTLPIPMAANISKYGMQQIRKDRQYAGPSEEAENFRVQDPHI